MDATWKAGLEDVIAARSAICRVDGEAGRLYYLPEMCAGQ